MALAWPFNTGFTVLWDDRQAVTVICLALNGMRRFCVFLLCVTGMVISCVLSCVCEKALLV